MSRYATDSAELVEVLNIDIDVLALTHCLYRKQVFKLGLYLRLHYFTCQQRSSLNKSLKGVFYPKLLSVKVLQKNVLISGKETIASIMKALAHQLELDF